MWLLGAPFSISISAPTSQCSRWDKSMDFDVLLCVNLSLEVGYELPQKSGFLGAGGGFPLHYLCH